MRRRGFRAGWLPAAFSIGWASAAGAGETVTYSYDALGRLTGASSTGSVNNGVATTIGYDPAGNRSSYVVSGAGGPTVAGGSFEAPEVGASFAYAPAGSPAGFAGYSGIAGNGSAWGFAAAPDGDQAAFVQSVGATSAISLPVSGLVPGSSYAATFSLAARPGYGANPIAVSFNGAALGTFTPASTAFAASTGAAFTAAATTGTLTFTGTASATDISTGLDRVTVAAAGSN
jgi:hypothetical protein